MRITKSFRNLCKNLTNNYIDTENKYVYVKNYLLKNYGKDSNVLLQLKADAMQNQNDGYESNQVALLALVFSAVGTSYSLLPIPKDVSSISMVSFIYLMVLIISTIKIGFERKCNEICIWREYILLAIDEILNTVELKPTKHNKCKKR